MSQRPPVAMTRTKSRIKPRIPLLGFDICCLRKIFDELNVFLIALRAELTDASNRSPAFRYFLKVLDFGISAVELAHPFPLEKYGLTAPIACESLTDLFRHQFSSFLAWFTPLYTQSDNLRNFRTIFEGILTHIVLSIRDLVPMLVVIGISFRFR